MTVTVGVLPTRRRRKPNFRFGSDVTSGGDVRDASGRRRNSGISSSSAVETRPARTDARDVASGSSSAVDPRRRGADAEMSADPVRGGCDDGSADSRAAAADDGSPPVVGVVVVETERRQGTTPDSAGRSAPADDQSLERLSASELDDDEGPSRKRSRRRSDIKVRPATEDDNIGASPCDLARDPSIAVCGPSYLISDDNCRHDTVSKFKSIVLHKQQTNR